MIFLCRFCSGFFLVRRGQYFLVNILAVLFSVSGGSERNSKSSWFLVGWLNNWVVWKNWEWSYLSIQVSWSWSLSWVWQNHVDFQFISKLNNTAEIFTRKYWPCLTRKILEQRRPKQITSFYMHQLTNYRLQLAEKEKYV